MVLQQPVQPHLMGSSGNAIIWAGILEGDRCFAAELNSKAAQPQKK